MSVARGRQSSWWSRLKALTRRLAAGENTDRALDD
jgi:hypothetical protein